MGERADEIEHVDPDAVGVPAHRAAHTFEGGSGTSGSSSRGDEVGTVRSRIEQTRANMSDTIDAIQHKLSPGQLASQAKETVREATIGKAEHMVENVGGRARDAGTGFVETIRQNPVPAALAGIGLGWLFMSRSQSGGKSSPQRRYDVPYGYSQDYTGTVRGGSRGRGQAAGSRLGQAQGTVGQAAGQAQQKAGQIAGQAQDTAGQVVGQVQDTAGQVVGQVQDTAARIGSRAADTTQQAATGFQQMLDERPLAVAAGAVALGLAVGLAIPETPQEDQLMGETRDNLMGQAQQSVQETAQKVQTVAQGAVESAKETAKQQAQDQNLT